MRRFATLLALALSSAGGSMGEVERVAARVGDEAVRVSELDALSPRKTEALQERLRVALREALEQSIDAALLDAAPPPEHTPSPPTEAEIEAFLRAHPEDFGGAHTPDGSARERDVQREAVRYYLARESRAAGRAVQLAELRRAAQIERLLPAAAATEPLAPERIVARIDGRPLRARALEAGAALRLYRIRGELYRERRRNLTGLLEERLLALHAQSLGGDVPALVEAAAGAPVDAAAIEAYRAEEVAAGRPAPDPERARPYLAFRRAQRGRARLLESASAAIPVQVLLTAPTPPRLPVHVEGARWLGSQDAGAPRLVVYSNLRCRQCRLSHREIDRLLSDPAPPRVAFRDYVPGYDPAARTAAVWMRCAAEEQRHRALRALLLEAKPPDFAGRWLDGAEPEAVARRIGATAERFASCVTDPRTAAGVERDTEQALHLGFETAPAFVAEGHGLTGVQNAAGLRRALDQAARESGR